jgi:DNA-binding phage protein
LPSIPVPKYEEVVLDTIDPKTQKPVRVPSLGYIAKYILATSPVIRAKNIRQLAMEIGIPYTNVRQWFQQGNSPNMKNLSTIFANLNTDVVQFYMQWEGFSHTTASRHGAVIDRIAGVLSKPEHAQKLLAILLEEQRLGLLSSFLDQTAAQLGVDSDHPIRAISRMDDHRR